jgi:hypothetical protein
VWKRDGAHLPHWTSEVATYSIPFRLADSLPRVVIEGFLREREEIVARARDARRELSLQESIRLNKLYAAKIESFLDSGRGSCVLRDDDAAQIVKNALVHFNGQRYPIHAWCVMPNHVHVVAQPRRGHDLPRILHSWKSFTASRINELLDRRGRLWQAEYYDHLIRNAD